ncbi:MAG TPA: hypothetical protein PLD38_08430 [Pyrinomonadaceae bacterium]|nr:hypothetical protein [Chloracidobacterium sp.]MBP9935317.1 hypothetical protein [Pyrinomonadaceae bacterium]MBK7804534.1 hypothetical protein [Chloracidobacterium sp.]MBK9438935.1 hypothetical protein [Chloracidobacterium sp.]MBK9768857.1 hypothetical protein [Chloracidobacterium sp.]
MKLANKVYIATLLLLTLAFAAMAQSNGRPDSDPRNTAPTVGTGGPVGGATGLFTVYDGQTLRKGEYTISLAMSNYDRDPGDADFTSVPASFQIGLTNKVELFFNTEAYRAIKVNSRRNLSSNYLPNSQFFIPGPGLTRAPAIVLAPRGPGANPFINSAVYRPTGAPYVTYPFVGGNAGTFGLLPPFFSGPVFGFAAGTNATYGAAAGGNGASLFPGIGSVYGSILPGVVLRSTALVGVTGAPAGEGPLVFSQAPSYLPDAPFINRGYGESAFNSFDVGFKWRMNNIHNAVGYGLVASYTYYADNANDAAGFNQLQRGASAGGNMGDVALTFFADARLAKWANLSANIGYRYTSKTKMDLPGGTFTALDRPDELQSSIGVDFPLNKFFQPIAEFRSLYYVGGRTPNAFENHPMDGIIGARIFPVRWASLGLAYRYNFNQQDLDSFDPNASFSSNVTIPCRSVTTGGGTVGGEGNTVCNPVIITSSWTGAPNGFVTSSDGNGYIAQLTLGRRTKRQTEIVNIPAVVNSVTISDTVITLGCAPGFKSRSGACNDNRTVNVATSASDAENDVLTYNYTVSGGRIVGSGANVQWDLSGVGKGTYTITTGVDDGCGVCGKTETKTITIEECADCVQVCSCPTLSVSGPAGTTDPGATMTFTLSGAGSNSVNWAVSAGSIESGQGTSSITVRTPADGSVSNITATAEVGGIDPTCNCVTTASESAPVAPKPSKTLIDEFGKAPDDDVKARVDNFYIQLNNNPSAQGYIVNEGTPVEIKKRKTQIMKAINFRKYDVNRVTFVDGNNTGAGINTKFWLVPAGADAP